MIQKSNETRKTASLVLEPVPLKRPRNVDPRLFLAMERHPAGRFDGIIKATMTGAQMEALVNDPQFSAHDIAGTIITFRGASKTGIMKLSADPRVTYIEGSRALHCEQSDQSEAVS